jgi:hypothetical protein
MFDGLIVWLFLSGFDKSKHRVKALQPAEA